MNDKNKIIETIKKDAQMNDALSKHIIGSSEKGTQKIISEDKYPDHIEVDFGGTGRRGKVYFNSSRLEEAKERIKNYLEIEEHKNELLAKREVKSNE